MDRISSLSFLAVALLPASMCWASVNPGMPPALTVGSVTYLSGGADPAQEKAMRSEAAKYPLELDFLWGRGAKETELRNVEWSIRNAAGHELLDASSNGPVILVALPNGRYTVTGHYEGKPISHVVDVHKGRHETVALEWPQ